MATAWRRQHNDGNGGGIMATAWRQVVFAAWRRRLGGGSLVVAAEQQSEGGCDSNGRRGVVFVHINESAVPGCECLATLLKGKLPVHECRVLCCY
jgi:hypothetical protein